MRRRGTMTAMRTMIDSLLVVLLLCLLCGDAMAQEPIRIDRPKEGATVETEIEVAGVATPGKTVEVWVDRVFIVDTVAEPDGWYVARITRPPSATAQSRIFVHELDEQGQRTSSAVVRVVWSEVPVPEKPVVPPPDVAVDGPVEDMMTDGTDGTGAPADAQAAETTTQPSPVRKNRAGRVAVESLLSVAGGITGAVIGVLFASAIGQPESSARVGASVLLGSVGGGFGAAGAVYGGGALMKGNGSFTWTAIGGLGGAFLLVTVGLATANGGGVLFLPASIIAFGLPVLAYELTSDIDRNEPAVVPSTPQPTVGVTPEGKVTFGLKLRF